MTDAVERVARALDPECFDAEVERVYGELWAFDRQAKARRQARAAILALREPTPEMVRYCRGASEEAGYARDCAVQWRDMIDAALGDPA